jgi:hypothetical protein
MKDPNKIEYISFTSIKLMRVQVNTVMDKSGLLKREVLLDQASECQGLKKHYTSWRY